MLSIIIPVKDGYEDFKNTFEAVLKQTFQPKEIIIIASSEKNYIDEYFMKL